MLGVYDFCGHYEWTFEWLIQEGGRELLDAYWLEAISIDSQRHARELIIPFGFDGMKRYWTPTLEEEGGECAITAAEDALRIDMHACPSKGFLMRNGLQQHPDYCDHCMAWIHPVLREAGFHVDHEHNHLGQCWWEIRRAEDAGPPSDPGDVSGPRDIRLYPSWGRGQHDRYPHAINPEKSTEAEIP